jgi:hypothetical protein
MPVTGGSAKKKDRILSQNLTAQKRLVSTARVLLSHVDSPYPIFYIVTINLTTLVKSSLITKHNFIHLIIFIFHFVKHFTTKFKPFFVTIAQSLYQL